MPSIHLFPQAFQVHDEKYRSPSTQFLKSKPIAAPRMFPLVVFTKFLLAYILANDFAKENDSEILFLFQLQNMGVLVRDNLIG
mmetsp:Transcript_14761/g.16704  ORF Transcript_14761/g.16704 Transcript_14761/m.16704 type:complete len:83 (-) Transcript_14761:1232-1480(-)